MVKINNFKAKRRKDVFLGKIQRGRHLSRVFDLEPKKIKGV